MRAPEPLARPEHDLVLVGGGHSHALVLRALLMRPLSGTRITLISESAQSAYSGMLPGVIAGHYQPEEIQIDLRHLCEQGGFRFIQARCTGLDVAARQLFLPERPSLQWDFLSLNTGATPDLSVPGAAEFCQPVKPINAFHERWKRCLDDLHTGVVNVIGGGAGGVEIAMAMAQRLHVLKRQVTVRLVHGGKHLLPGYPGGLRRQVQRHMALLQIQVELGFRVQRVTESELYDGEGRSLPGQVHFWCTGSRADSLPAAEGCDLYPGGYLRVHDTLQSVQHPDVFAAGDCAWIDSSPLPRAGVYAVRQARVLENNLRQHVAGHTRLLRYRPQRHFLSLIACGGRQAVGARGRFSLPAWLGAERIWHLKDRIDQAFMEKFRPAPFVPEAEAENAMRCRGCAAKLPRTVLGQALGAEYSRGDDAAVQGQWVQSIDALDALVSDPWLLGRLCARHALSDLAAMGAVPESALMLAQIPAAAAKLQSRDLAQARAGIQSVLQSDNGVTLLGGHSLEGELMLALSVTGRLPDGQPPVGKRGARPGAILVLSKPLGVGVLFAAAMRGCAQTSWIDAALQGMQADNFQAASVFLRCGVQAMTDITGFGLAGHLVEMLDQNLAARVDLAALPLYPGALRCWEAGLRSSAAAMNEQSTPYSLQRGQGHVQPGQIAVQVQNEDASPHSARLQALFDPQTCGGLLAAIPAGQWEHCRDLGKAAGLELLRVGYLEEAAEASSSDC